eukprot:928-Pelagomonas_calceolata.AAC.2
MQGKHKLCPFKDHNFLCDLYYGVKGLVNHGYILEYTKLANLIAYIVTSWQPGGSHPTCPLVVNVLCSMLISILIRVIPTLWSWGHESIHAPNLNMKRFHAPNLNVKLAANSAHLPARF